MSEFVHLHVHTCYSVNDGLSKVNELVDRASELGMKSLAITEHGNMFSAVKFYKACKKKGIKPIIGIEMYVQPKGKKVKERDNRHLILLAKNDIGYKNLVKIVSEANMEGYYYNPRTDYTSLKKYSEGIIASSACLAGDIAREYQNTYHNTGDEDKAYRAAREKAKLYIDIFGKDNYYLEVQDNGIEDQYKWNEVIYKLADELGLDVILTNDCHYVKAEDWIAHDALMALQDGKKLSDKDRRRYETSEFYIKSYDELNSGKIPIQCLENTVKVADKCNFEFRFGEYLIPKFTAPENFDSKSYLRHLVLKGLADRYDEVDDALLERMEFELGTIDGMGFNDYFLITWDFVDFAKRSGIRVGPGRGSAAGSIVSYALRITDVDPIRFDLLFERFLNPDRISMPDIDIDFSRERRGEVIDYVINKYGSENVSRIITFGTYGAKQSVRASGRVLGLPNKVVDEIAKAIPDIIGISIRDAFNESETLNDLYKSNKDAKNVIDLARSIEGNPSHTGSHAAGILIAPGNVSDYFPVIRSKDGDTIVAWDMNTLEELGGLKCDFLGLRNLDIITDTVDNVRLSRDIHITEDDLMNLIDDSNSYTLLGQGKTKGIFQTESEGMAMWGNQMNVSNIDEASALLALYRPGPMDYIPTYVQNKFNPDDIKVAFEPLREILESTYGVLCYQEQVMKTARVMAGYTAGLTDGLRKAIGKKNADMIAEHKNYFVYGKKDANVAGAKALGFNEQELLDYWEDVIVPFGKYCFNKSHAVAYAYITAQTGGLKFYFPSEYMAALLTSVTGNSAKVYEYIKDCEDMNIKVLPPSINYSTHKYIVNSNSDIVMSLATIKGVGEDAVIQIAEERERNGKFTSFSDFVYRCCLDKVTTATVENLIVAGAFNEFGLTKSALLSVCFSIIENIKKDRKVFESSPVIPIFESMYYTKDVVPNIKEYPNSIYLKMEKESLGIYMSGHPLEKYKSLMKRKSNVLASDFSREVDDTGNVVKNYGVYHSQSVNMIGIISEIRKIKTKKKDDMAFVTIEDLSGSVSVTLFPNQYDNYKDLLKKDEIIYVYGEVDHSSDYDPQIICRKISTVKLEKQYSVIIKDVKKIDTLYKIQKQLGNICQNCSGNIPTYIETDSVSMLLPSKYWVNNQGLEAIRRSIPSALIVRE